MISLDDLNQQQAAAVTAPFDRNLCILSGAGTGKTAVLTHRIAAMLESGIRAPRICAMTFTRKAANEMRERLEKLLPAGESSLLNVGTFHSLGLALVREHHKKFELPARFSVATPADCTRMLRGIVKGTSEETLEKLKSRNLSAATIVRQISNMTNRMDLRPPPMPGGNVPTIAEAVEAFEENDTLVLYFRQLLIDEKQKNDCVDYDDLLRLPLEILDGSEALTPRFDVFLVDEFQDTNPIQYELLMRMSGRGRKPITIVGDDDQSIYGFRGAVPHVMQTFVTDFHDVNLVKLEQNYRCTNSILAASNVLIAENRNRLEKTLFSDRDGGEFVVVDQYANDRDEAAAIADSIQSAIRTGVRAGQIAVMYRNTHVARPIEKEFLRRNIPYTMIGNAAFFERFEIACVMNHLKAAIYPGNRLALSAVMKFPTKGIGDGRLGDAVDYADREGIPFSDALLMTLSFEQQKQALHTMAALEEMVRGYEDAERTLAESISFMVDRLGLKEAIRTRFQRGESDRQIAARLQAIDTFIEEAGHFEKTFKDGSGGLAVPEIADFVEKCTLHLDLDRDEEASVKFVTIHKAKGLEFDFVCLAGVEDGLFRKRSAGDAEDEPGDGEAVEAGVIEDDEEARRLLYVAMTRARHRLVMTTAASRWVNGAARQATISSLLDAPLAQGVIRKGKVSPPQNRGSRIFQSHLPLPFDAADPLPGSEARLELRNAGQGVPPPPPRRSVMTAGVSLKVASHRQPAIRPRSRP